MDAKDVLLLIFHVSLYIIVDSCISIAIINFDLLYPFVKTFSNWQFISWMIIIIGFHLHKEYERDKLRRFCDLDSGAEDHGAWILDVNDSESDEDTDDL